MKLAFTLIILCFSLALMAQKAGTLDSSFGAGGKVLTSVPGGYPLFSASVANGNGNIILVGSTAPSQITNGGFSILKYLPDGVLDTSFGSKGQVIIENLGFAEAVAVQPDDKIIVAGYDAEYSISKYFTLARLNPDGSLDWSFGDSGEVQDSYGTIAHDIVLQQDGKIVVSGYVGVSFITIRYMPDGTHDNNFGTNGVVTNFTSLAIANSNFIQPDGKIVAAGDNGQKALLVRYNTDGSMDESFGSSGIVTTKINNFVSHVLDAILQTDGKIIAVGTTSDGFTYNTMLLRYLPNGNPDSSFGTNGMLISQLQYSSAGLRIALQKDDKIVISGYALNETSQPQFLLERFNSNGILDSSFGNDGLVITDLGYPAESNGLIIQSSGKIVATGFAINALTDTTEYYAALARYNNNLTKKQIIVQKIKHYIQTHNAQATTLNNVSIYPNPAQSILHIQGLSSNAKLTVVDLNGSVALSHELRAVSGVYDLNIASLHTGNYLLKIETNGEVVTKQFVKE